MKDKDTKLLQEAYNKINESTNLNLSEEEKAHIRAALNGEANIYDDPELDMKLQDYFSNEMPYGIQKARTGDPEEWMLKRLASMFRFRR